MKHIEEYLKSSDKPVLFVGKGPSFDLKDKILLSKYNVIALNHSLEKLDGADMCNIIDIDVVDDLGEQLYEKAKNVSLPFCPHVKWKATSKTLPEFIKEYDVLQRLENEGRLYFYNLSSGPVRHDAGILYPACINSGDTLYNIVGQTKPREKVYSIGVDGGSNYSEEFSHITPLRNGRASFDDQDPYIEKFSAQNSTEFIRLRDLEEIKVYVGSAPEQEIPAKVLEYSIKLNTFNPATVTPLHELPTEHRLPADPKNHPRTPFSFKRFFIPELATGKAFYLDSDMLVFGDMGDLLKHNFDGYDGICCAGMDKYEHWQHSNYAMLMLDCDNIEWTVDSIIDQLDSGELTYESLMFEFKHAKIKPEFDSGWNSLDAHDENTTLLHYTDMSKQPWRVANHPLEGFWFSYLKGAVETGFISKDLVYDHGDKGWIRKFR
ncbi:hypothetical protein H8E06_00840 [bacterium]|nr:hypothetical protein [bacterium]